MTDKNKETVNKKVKSLNLTELNKQNKKLDGRTEHFIFANGDEYRVRIDIHFRKSKQYKLLDDIIDFFDKGNDNIDLLDLATPYTSLLIIKYFTDIYVPDDIERALEILDILVDLELIAEILNLMPEEEVAKIYELLSATVDRMRENIEEADEEAKLLADKVENPVLKEMLLNESEQSE